MRGSGNRVIEYISGLRLVGGDHDGALFQPLGWETRFIRKVFNRTGPAFLSVAKGNGKSALVAAIASSVVDPQGPLHGNRNEVICVAQSFEIARVIFEDVLSFLTAKGYDLDDRVVWQKQDSANRAWLQHRPSKARIRCLGSNPANMHGLRIKLAILDEPAMYSPQDRDKVFAAISTGLGKTPQSRLICLGTKSPDPMHWFSQNLESPPADGYSQVHAADPDDNPFSAATWAKANPSLSHLPSLKAKIKAEAVEAKDDPVSFAAFGAYRLNLGVSDVTRSELVDAATWKQCETVNPPMRSGIQILGIDLGSGAAMSAAAAYWPHCEGGGKLELLAAFPRRPDLAERGRKDHIGNLYQIMAQRSELVLCGDLVVSVEELLGEALDRFGKPDVIVADRWREHELRQALDAIRFPPAALIFRGQGYRDGGEDVRLWRRACVGKRVYTTENLVLRSALAEAVVVTDAAGNSKLAKAGEGGRRGLARDDAIAASILAVAEGMRRKDAPRRAPRFAMIG